ncbi:peptidoglycan-binding protein [Actinoplanes flavus]|uniref:Peptidoglycan-binding protein n=1 Tax=Actinoplanes flavus TaxID=2820290 RepID=A0ABS3US90_9ACTN|nr:peptidoglycan-binding protein [Actinoplanes flavus]MBO3741427.1 peptidoglycan-binding protein [Actinoplanes flavus]
MSQTETRTEPQANRARRRWPAAVVVLLLAGTGAATVVVLRPGEKQAEQATYQNRTPFALADVTRGDISATSLQNGKLGYAGSYQVVNNADGKLTGAPSAGQVIKAGKPIYRVDGQPVIFMTGPHLPAYRALERGLKGADVRQLNASLVALKYATRSQIDPDSDYFGKQTYWAVWRFQKAMKLEKTGSVPLGQVIFLPAKELRITSVASTVGAGVAPGTTVLEASSTERRAALWLNASQQSQVKAGDKVTVTMPTGKSTPGVVSAVGKIASTEGDKTTVDVSIKLSKPEETGALDQTPVQIAIVSDVSEDVLSVPVSALLALAGGGYAVEVVAATGAHTLVRVETGLIDDGEGRVEVSGDGLAEGQKVAVPAS